MEPALSGVAWFGLVGAVVTTVTLPLIIYIWSRLQSEVDEQRRWRGDASAKLAVLEERNAGLGERLEQLEDRNAVR